MAETIGLRDLKVNYEQTLAEAMAGGKGEVKGKFIAFRIAPQLRDESKFGQKFPGVEVPVNAHFFQVPAGYQLTDLPKFMNERLIRGPKDIREIFALAQVIDEEKCEFAIYAPEISGRDDVILKVHRWPEWPGLGLTPSTIDPDDENAWDFECIGFSEG